MSFRTEYAGVVLSITLFVSCGSGGVGSKSSVDEREPGLGASSHAPTRSRS
jgi:hypothetical protein